MQSEINAKHKSKQNQQSEQNRDETQRERFAAKPGFPSTSEQNKSKHENQSEIVANAKRNQRYGASRQKRVITNKYRVTSKKSSYDENIALRRK